MCANLRLNLHASAPAQAAAPDGGGGVGVGWGQGVWENRAVRFVRTIQATTREEAERADREANWAKTPQERLAEVEFLRAQRYPGGVAPRFQRVLEIAQRPRG
ncbi:hypothetical protein DAERI_140131 [Deinococcus aerius]|uniref:Uncharacterized protein n=1 Tax=Deinococcus aerius TaxID=200253 RepID=A0A2I9DA28_9DEIO|nr:hypothetical protein DAERI_140131 [Deinococcus aerius]